MPAERIRSARFDGHGFVGDALGAVIIEQSRDVGLVATRRRRRQTLSLRILTRSASRELSVRFSCLFRRSSSFCFLLEDWPRRQRSLPISPLQADLR